MNAVPETAPRVTEGPPPGYCVDGCSSGGAPVPISELDDYKEHTGLLTGIGLVIAALETAVWLACR